MKIGRFALNKLCWACAVLGAAVPLSPALRAQTKTSQWSVAVLDKLLAGVAPGQRLVQVGDMQILTVNLQTWRNKLAGAPPPNLAFDGTAPTWTEGNIYYTFDSSVSAAHQKAFLDGANEWATFANLHVIPRTTQANYMTVQELPGLQGGQSAVGMVGGQQFLYIGPGSWSRPTICHEFGHTLGLVHEHQRSNRDSFVVVLSTNIQPGEEDSFVVLPDSRNQGPYDFLSIMHYNRNSFAINPAYDTLEPLPAYIQFLDLMGQQDDPVLSDLDRAGVAAIYGAGPVIGPVVTNTLDSGPGTLRTAIYYAFDHPGTTITFNVPTNDPGFAHHVFTFQPTDQYPVLINATVLDGTSQNNLNPNGPAVQLSGALAPPPDVFPHGLRLGGSNCVVRSLAINGFPDSAIIIRGPGAVSNSVTGCYLGVDSTGNPAVSNGFALVTIDSGARGNTIGGSTAAARNIISGSTYHGLVIRDSGTMDNVVEGNYIGLDVTGTAAVSNQWAGIAIFNGAQSNRIGGALPSMRNVISGNGNQGLLIADPGTLGNLVQGNYIGLNAAGTAAIPNAWAGVDLFGGTSSNVIGGSVTSAGNVISGNSMQGVSISQTNTLGNLLLGNYIGVNPAGTLAVSNGSSGVQILNGAQATLVASNLISGNGNAGILIGDPGTGNNVVRNNYIGVNAAGTGALGNGWSGVDLGAGTTSNLIGGPGMGNVISGNGNQGVVVADPGTIGNVVAGNIIGANATGTAKLSNAWAGVSIFDQAQSNIIGGAAAGMRNIISGNGNQGLVIADPGTRGNVVAGNFIGLNAAGTAALSNAWAGVAIFGQAQSNVIGGGTPGMGNVISGNGNQGIILADPDTSGNTLAGNYIGLDATGNFAVGNAWAGVEMFNSAQATLIGGGVGSRNIISGNGLGGVVISGGVSGAIVQGNTIGLNVSSIPVPNLAPGVVLFSGAVSNQIGATALGAANVIADNLSDGVQLFDATTTGNSIRGNSIFGNSGVGIGLYNSANLSAVAPTLTSAAVADGLSVVGSLTSLPSTTFHLDFYASPPPQNTAQARTYIGTKDVVTSGGGSVSFSVSLGAIVPIGQIVTATATDPAGNTSPLSAGVAVTAVDSVGDGIPNAWRAAHFGGSGTTTNSQSCATCDPDHDGMNNLQEFLAGTNPTNAASVLRISALTPANTDLTLTFQTASGIVYRIEARDDVASGAWSLLADQLLGTGSAMQITDPGVLVLPRQFYRLSIEP